MKLYADLEGDKYWVSEEELLEELKNHPAWENFFKPNIEISGFVVWVESTDNQRVMKRVLSNIPR